MFKNTAATENLLTSTLFFQLIMRSVFSWLTACFGGRPPPRNGPAQNTRSKTRLTKQVETITVLSSNA